MLSTSPTPNPPRQPINLTALQVEQFEAFILDMPARFALPIINFLNAADQANRQTPQTNEQPAQP
jgi:hypothetical protein